MSAPVDPDRIDSHPEIITPKADHPSPKADHPSPKAKILPMHGPETAFVVELFSVIDRHAGNLTAFQLCGAMFAAAQDILANQEEFEE